jgi:hypothetical protein
VLCSTTQHTVTPCFLTNPPSYLSYLPCIYVIQRLQYTMDTTHSPHTAYSVTTVHCRLCSTSAVIDQIVKYIILESSTCPSLPSTTNPSNGFRKIHVNITFQSAKKSYCFLYASKCHAHHNL